MMYTLGIKSVYDPYIQKDPQAAKAASGSVWLTLKSIQEFKEHYKDHLEGFDIYGLVGCEGLELIHVCNGIFSLTKCAKLVQL